MMNACTNKEGVAVAVPDHVPDSSGYQTQQPVAAALGGVGGAHGPTIDNVVSLMPGFVYVFNHQTYANDFTNRSVAEHLGYSSREITELGDAVMLHIIHPDDHPLLAGHFDRIKQLTGDQTAQLEYRVVTKDGQERWLRSVDAVFERAADGQVLRHIGCATDVTTEKLSKLRLAQINGELEHIIAARTQDLADLNGALESRIAARTSELQEAIDELEQLTYIATHDLKVPVNNLCRLGLMLADQRATLSPEQAEQVVWMNECATQLRMKLQSLVLVAQLRLGSALPSETIDLRAAVDRALASHTAAGELDAGAVTVEISDTVRIDFPRFELGSILGSLIKNAIAYAAPGRPLRVRIYSDVKDGAVALHIADNGTGFDDRRDRQKIFALFQRAHKTPAGSGISLYCARRMLLRRGGDITASAVRGQGATLTVRFAVGGA